MLEYNTDKNILYGYKNEFIRPDLNKVDSQIHIHESFLDYIENDCKDQVMDEFFPKLRETLKESDDNYKLSLSKSDIQVVQEDATIFNDRTYHVKCSFDIAGKGKTPPIVIMKIPVVNADNTIEYQSKKYAFIHMLEQEPTISYEPNFSVKKPQFLKIKNERSYMNITDNPSAITIELSTWKRYNKPKKYNLLNLIFAMAKAEGYVDKPSFNFEKNGIEYDGAMVIWNLFRDFTTENLFRGKKKALNDLLYYSGANTSRVDAEEYSKMASVLLMEDPNGRDIYNNLSVRSMLNKMLSLDRAVGEVLYSDVVLPGKKGVIPAGNVITTNDVEAMNSAGVFMVYVKTIPNVKGWILKVPVAINMLPAGTKIDSFIRSIPECAGETGMYLTKDYKLDKPYMINKNEVLTDELLQLMMSCDIKDIIVAEKESTKESSYKSASFYKTIVSNRQVKGSIIGKTGDEANKWYYHDVNDNYVENTGAYTTFDFVALHVFARELFNGTCSGYVVSSDIGFRKKVVSLREQYRKAFTYAVRAGFNQMHNKILQCYKNSVDSWMVAGSSIENDFYPFEKYFVEYLRTNVRCIQMLITDCINNPIAYQSACTKVNVFTANKHSVSNDQRDIPIGSYGKIDPIEIPQSRKLGVVNNFTTAVSIDRNGIMYTPYFKVKKVTGSIYKVDTSKPEYLSVKDEESYVISDICYLNLDKHGIIQNIDDKILCQIPVRSGLDKQSFDLKNVKDVEYVTSTSNQILGWAASTIPFMGSNDSARAIFAVAQEKAAKGLVFPEEPDIMTSAYEQYKYLNDIFCVIAEGDGEVEDVIRPEINHRSTLSIAPDVGCTEIYVRYNDPELGFKRYIVPDYRDGNGSVTKFDICCTRGQIVKKNDMLVSSNFISRNGILQFGVNLLAAFIPTGYNYEDGYHITESACEKLASYRINTEDFSKSKRRVKSFRLALNDGHRWLNPDTSKVAMSYTHLLSVSRNTPSLATVRKAYGFYEGWSPIKAADSHGAVYGATLKTVSIDEVSQGDKASNRHGNKGVVSKKESNATAPRLRNGMPVDICLNPTGLPSRMNIGQVKELHLGLVAHVLGIKISIDSFNSISDTELERLMSFVVDLMNSKDDPSSVYSQYPDLPKELFDHCTANINNIRIYANCFDKDGTTILYLPKNGRYTETRVSVGFLYVYKLIQEVHKKKHSRGNEMTDAPYSEMANAPTHGSSAVGGQRMGNMEVSALAAYGVSEYVQELMNERCDNAIARSNFYVDTYLKGKDKLQYRNNKPSQRRSVTQLLYTLLSLGVMVDCDENEFAQLASTNYDDLKRLDPRFIRSAFKGDYAQSNQKKLVDKLNKVNGGEIKHYTTLENAALAASSEVDNSDEEEYYIEYDGQDSDSEFDSDDYEAYEEYGDDTYISDEDWDYIQQYQEDDVDIPDSNFFDEEDSE